MTQYDHPADGKQVHQTTVQQVVADLVQLLRRDRDKYDDPRARALFETAVIIGLDHALKDETEGSSRAGTH